MLYWDVCICFLKIEFVFAYIYSTCIDAVIYAFTFNVLDNKNYATDKTGFWLPCTDVLCVNQKILHFIPLSLQPQRTSKIRAPALPHRAKFWGRMTICSKSAEQWTSLFGLCPTISFFFNTPPPPPQVFFSQSFCACVWFFLNQVSLVETSSKSVGQRFLQFLFLSTFFFQMFRLDPVCSS